MSLPNRTSSSDRHTQLSLSFRRGGRPFSAATFCALLLCAGGAGAPVAAAEPVFRINGYGTLGLTHSSEDQADFASSPLHVRDGAGYTDAWSLKVDSRLALQAEARLSERVNGVVQVISEQQYDGSFTPAFEWAYLHVQLTPDVALQAGRIVLPALLTSGYRKVGFATPWIRPPQEVYQLMPVTQFDGIDTIWSSRVGAVTNHLQLAIGTSQRKLVGGSDYEVKRGVVLADTAEVGALTLFASLGQLHYTAEMPTGPAAPPADMASSTNSDRNEMRFMGAGFRYDPGSWLTTAEWARARGPESGDSDGWYVTGGYRFGPLMPYITVAANNVRRGILGPGGLPPPEVREMLSPHLVTIFSQNFEQERTSIGVRWDISPSTALKMEYDEIRLKNDAIGFQTNIQPGFRSGESFSTFSAAIDFLF